MVEAQVADVLYRIKPYDDGNSFPPIILIRKFTLVASARYIPNDSVDADDHAEEGEELPLEGGPVNGGKCQSHLRELKNGEGAGPCQE